MSANPLAGALALAVILFAVAGSAPQRAGASAFYNDGDIRILVSLDCGTFCYNDFALLPGDSASRPGKGGEFFVRNDAPYCEKDIHPDVPASGYAAFHKRETKPPYYWSIYRSDNSLVGDYNVIFGGLSPIFKQCYEP